MSARQFADGAQPAVLARSQSVCSNRGLVDEAKGDRNHAEAARAEAMRLDPAIVAANVSQHFYFDAGSSSFNAPSYACFWIAGPAPPSRLLPT